MQQEEQSRLYQAQRLKDSSVKLVVWMATVMAIVVVMPAKAEAPTPPKDPLTRVVWDMFQMHLGKTVCTNGPTSVSVRAMPSPLKR